MILRGKVYTTWSTVQTICADIIMIADVGFTFNRYMQEDARILWHCQRAGGSGLSPIDGLYGRSKTTRRFVDGAADLGTYEYLRKKNLTDCGQGSYCRVGGGRI